MIEYTEAQIVSNVWKGASWAKYTLIQPMRSHSIIASNV